MLHFLNGLITESENSEKMKGIMYCLLGATLWAFSGVCGDFVMTNYSVTPLFVTVFRTICATILFGITIFVTNRSAAHDLLNEPAAKKELLIFGVFGLFSCQFMYLWAIQLTNAGTATVLQSSNVIIILFVTCFLNKTLPHAKEVVGVITAFLSVFVIATQGNPTVLVMPLSALLVCIGLAIAESAYILLPINLFSNYGSLVPTGLAMAISAILSTVIWLVTGITDGSMAAGTLIPQVDIWGIMALLCVGVLGTYGAFAIFLYGVSLIGPVKSSMIGATESISASIISMIIMGTVFTGWDWLGLVLMLITFFLVSMKSKKDSV